MDIINSEINGVMNIALTGRLDTVSAPSLEKLFYTFNNKYKEVVLDFTNLDYVSSAGLRVILIMHKEISAIGKMTIRNVKEGIMDIFETTGFTNLLNIE